VTPLHQAEMLEALLLMCESKKEREKMSRVGRQRVKLFYNIDGMVQAYQSTYQKANELWQALASN